MNEVVAQHYQSDRGMHWLQGKKQKHKETLKEKVKRVMPMRVMMEKEKKIDERPWKKKALFGNMDSKQRQPEFAADFCYC